MKNKKKNVRLSVIKLFQRGKIPEMYLTFIILYIGKLD